MNFDLLFFLLENAYAHKIAGFRGVGFWKGGGGSANFICMGAGIFLNVRNFGKFVSNFASFFRNSVRQKCDDNPVGQKRHLDVVSHK